MGWLAWRAGSSHVFVNCEATPQPDTLCRSCRPCVGQSALPKVIDRMFPQQRRGVKKKKARPLMAYGSFIILF